MNAAFFQRSLKARVTLFSLAIFLISIWLLSFYASWMLRVDMERVMGEAQFSTASHIAATVNADLNARLGALEIIAESLSPVMSRSPATRQTLLENLPVFQTFFNGGTFVVGVDGTAIASVPASAERLGVNYMERDFIVAALRDGKAMIGRPVVGKQLNVPIFVMAVPIRNARGKVSGVLAGVTDLSKAGFLDAFATGAYGKSGGYLLISAQHRLIVTASDKRRVMEALPAPGIIPVMDNLLQGAEGTNIFTNARGVEVLNSGKIIPLAGWRAVVSLPVTEAFAPIRDMQRRILWVTILLTLLAGGLTWWVLRRQLAPLFVAAKTVALMSESKGPLSPLAVANPDEIGQLIEGFNHLLDALQHRENALRESHETLDRIVETTLDGYWCVDSLGFLRGVNNAYCQQSGYRRAELLGMQVAELVLMETPAETATWLQRVIEQGGDQFESVHRRKDGTVWHVEVSATFSNVAGGQILAFLRNISERKQTEDVLLKSEERFRQAMEATTDGLWDWNVAEDTGYFSPAYYSMLGYEPGEFIMNGQSWMDLIHPHDYQYAISFNQDCVENRRQSFEVEYRMKARDGSWVWILGRGKALERDAQGRALRMIGTHVDITERKQIEMALVAATVEADIANRAKSEFLAHMSHEIRTPMNAIVGAARLIENQRLTKRQRGYTEIMRYSSQVLLSLIDNILDLSKIEAAQITLNAEIFDLVSLLDATLRSVSILVAG